MQNPVPDELYPSSTAAGEAIPLAAVRPTGFYLLLATTTLVLPEDVNLVSFYSDVECTVTFTGSTIVGDFTSEGFYALADVSYELVLPKDVTVTLSGSGRVIMNLLQKWQQMTNIGTYYRS